MSAEKIHSEILGKGPPLLLLHGWGHSIGEVRGLGEVLSAAYEVHMLDLPGFGSSAQLAEDAGLDEYVAAVLEYLRSKPTAPWILAGHSFGGRICVKIAAAHADLVRNLVLINTSGIKRQRSVAARVRLFFIRWTGKLVKQIDRLVGTSLFKDRFAKRFGSADYQRAGALRKTFVKIVNDDLSETAKLVKAHTLLLWGELDPETPLEVGRRFSKLIPSSEFVLLPGKGHVPFYDIGSHLCAYHLYRFLDPKRAA